MSDDLLYVNRFLKFKGTVHFLFTKIGEFMIILGIDPGYAIVGYGVLRSERGRYEPLEYGAVVTKAEEDFSRRLEIIYDRIYEISTRWQPQALSIEKLYFQNNQKTAIGVAEAGE